MNKQKVKKVFKGIGKALSIALIVFGVILIIFLVVSKVQGNPPTLFGHQMYFIRTGSMSDYEILYFQRHTMAESFARARTATL